MVIVSKLKCFVRWNAVKLSQERDAYSSSAPMSSITMNIKLFASANELFKVLQKLKRIFIWSNIHILHPEKQDFNSLPSIFNNLLNLTWVFMIYEILVIFFPNKTNKCGNPTIKNIFDFTKLIFEPVSYRFSAVVYHARNQLVWAKSWSFHYLVGGWKPRKCVESRRWRQLQVISIVNVIFFPNFVFSLRDYTRNI